MRKRRRMHEGQRPDRAKARPMEQELGRSSARPRTGSLGHQRHANGAATERQIAAPDHGASGRAGADPDVATLDEGAPLTADPDRHFDLYLDLDPSPDPGQ